MEHGLRMIRTDFHSYVAHMVDFICQRSRVKPGMTVILFVWPRSNSPPMEGWPPPGGRGGFPRKG